MKKKHLFFIREMLKEKLQSQLIIFLFHIMKKKTHKTQKTQKTQKTKKIKKLFFTYSTNKQYLTKRQIVRLMKKEFKLSYSNHVVTSLMNIWGKKFGSSHYIIKDHFPKLFLKPNGFFRDISL